MAFLSAEVGRLVLGRAVGDETFVVSVHSSVGIVNPSVIIVPLCLKIFRGRSIM